VHEVIEVSNDLLEVAPRDSWRTYDESVPGMETFRIPSTDLAGQSLTVSTGDGETLSVEFREDGLASWSADGVLADATGGVDAYDAVAVREDVFFVNLAFTSVDREAVSIAYSTATRRAVIIRSVISAEKNPELPRVEQSFFAATVGGGEATGEVPGPTRELIGHRKLYRYSPSHLYEHVYLSSERYVWQCIQGVQRGHGAVDMATHWKLGEGLYVFCFREFKIDMCSVFLLDLGYELTTTGIFLGLNSKGVTEHTKAGGHVYPLGAVSYPDIQPL
jgi:hypothetical protein